MTSSDTVAIVERRTKAADMAACTCGAKPSAHPLKGYSESGACLEALKTSKVMTTCDWPTCGKRIRKYHLGENFCGPHGKQEFGAFMGIMNLEGPATLMRGLPTLAERVEFWRTRKLPQSRLGRVSFEDSHIHCGLCGAGLIVINDPDWSPDLPNSMSCRYRVPGSAGSAEPWGIPICRCCSTANCQHCLWHGDLIIGHQLDAHGHCTRCGRSGLKAMAL